MNKHRLLPACALLAAAAFGLSACTGGSTPAASSTGAAPASTSPSASSAAPSTSAEASTSASATEATASTPASETSSSSAGTAAASKIEEKKASSETITDEVLGDKIKVTGIANGFQGTGTWATPPGGTTYVAVKYTVTAGTKYYNSTSCSNLLLKTDAATSKATSITTSVKADMSEQKLTPFDSPEPGKTAEGYCVYYVKAPTDTNLTLVYYRLGLQASGKTYPKVEDEYKIKVG